MCYGQLHVHMTTAVALDEEVSSVPETLQRPVRKGIDICIHTYTYLHIYIYIYIYVCVCVYVCDRVNRTYV